MKTVKQFEDVSMTSPYREPMPMDTTLDSSRWLYWRRWFDPYYMSWWWYTMSIVAAAVVINIAVVILRNRLDK